MRKCEVYRISSQRRRKSGAPLQGWKAGAWARIDLAILALYLFLALVLTWPLVLQFSTHGPGHGVDDPAQTWSLWWVKYALFDLGTNPLSSNYVFYPLGINLVAYTPTFLNGVLSTPLQYAFGVIVAQNLLVFLSLVMGGYGTFLFVREIQWHVGERSAGASIGAVLAGAVYAFGAWHLNYLIAGHFMLLNNAWVPFFALFLVRIDLVQHQTSSSTIVSQNRLGTSQPQNQLLLRSADDAPSPWRNGALAGLFLVLQVWTELTFGPFLALLAGLYLLYLVFQRRKLAAGLGGPFRNVVALVAVTIVGVSPLLLNLLADIQRYGYYLTSGVGRIQIFSAELISFLVPSAQHPLLGAWASAITTAQTAYAFVGWAVLILAGIGFVSRRRAPCAWFWAILAVLFAVFMLGATLYIGGQDTGIPLPFALLRAVPLVNANRYPVRFNVMLMLALAPLIAFGAARLLAVRNGAPVLGGLVVLLALEQLVLPIPTVDLQTPAIFQTIRDEPGEFAILELPLGWRGSIAMQGKLDDKAQFYQTVHHKPLLGGITSRTPAFTLQYFLEAPILNSMIKLEDQREIDEARLAQDRALGPAVLRFFNIRYVDVNLKLTDPALLSYARDVFPLSEYYRDDERIIYRVGALPPFKTLDLLDQSAGLYFDDGWGRTQVTQDGVVFRWSTRGDAVVRLPLSLADHSLTLRLRGARPGQRLVLHVNGQAITTLTLKDTWEDYGVTLPERVLRQGLNEIGMVTGMTPLGERTGDDYSIGDTGALAPVDIAVTSAGFEAGRFGEIYVAGRNIIPNRRGYHLVAIAPRTGVVDAVGSFDTFADTTQSERLAEFVAKLPAGEIVAGAAMDDVSQNLNASAIAALQQLGVAEDLRYQFRAGHAFIGVKGALPGQALERVDGRLPANVAVGRNVASAHVGLALAGIVVDKEVTRQTAP